MPCKSHPLYSKKWWAWLSALKKLFWISLRSENLADDITWIVFCFLGHNGEPRICLQWQYALGNHLLCDNIGWGILEKQFPVFLHGIHFNCRGTHLAHIFLFFNVSMIWCILSWLMPSFKAMCLCLILRFTWIMASTLLWFACITKMGHLDLSLLHLTHLYYSFWHVKLTGVHFSHPYNHHHTLLSYICEFRLACNVLVSKSL